MQVIHNSTSKYWYFILAICAVSLGSASLSDRGVAEVYGRLDHASATSEDPEIGRDGKLRYASSRALSKGPDYWRSEGNHGKTIVAWVGTLLQRRTLQGIQIDWTYAAEEVTIQTSLNGVDGWETVVPWGKTNATTAKFEQHANFPSTSAKAIRIQMRYPVDKVFGISSVKVIGSGSPLIRLQSGITSVADMCLTADDSGDVLLENCLESMAPANGSDVWRFTDQGQIINGAYNTCITLKENSSINGGVIDLEDCTEAGKFNDGRSSWEIQPNNQIKLMNDGNFCLTFDGPHAGSHDVAVGKKASTSHPFTGDAHHEPRNAIDNDSKSYWASEDFSPMKVPEAVYFDIDLADSMAIQSVRIDWEYPAELYTVSRSDDGETWKLLKTNSGNSYLTTVDVLDNSRARYLRVTMVRPHPNLAQREGRLLYGIRNLAVLVNLLQTVVADCNQELARLDTRSKHFVEIVAEVNSGQSSSLNTAAQELNDALAKSDVYISRIKKEMPDYAACRDSVTKLKTRKENQQDALSSTMERVGSFGAEENGPHRHLGYSRSHPGQSCKAIHSLEPHIEAGFFWMNLPCSKTPVRAYCDMSTGNMFAVVESDEDLSAHDAALGCAEYGMAPLTLTSQAQVDAVQQMLRMKDHSPKRPFRVAVEIEKSGKFYDMSLQNEVTDVVRNILPVGEGNVIQVAPDGIRKVQSDSTKISGVICQKPAAASDVENVPIFGCKDTFGQETELFEQSSSIIAQCSAACPSEPQSSSSSYGSNSHICGAATSAGIETGAAFRITIKRSGRGNMSAEKIRELLKARELSSVSFSISSFEQDCPSTSIIPPQVKPKTGVRKRRSVPMSAKIEAHDIERAPMDERTEEAIKDLTSIMKLRNSDVDADVVEALKTKAREAVLDARTLIKPTGQLSEKLADEALDLATATSRAAIGVQNAAQIVDNKRRSASEHLNHEVAHRTTQFEFESWTPADEKHSGLIEQFDELPLGTSEDSSGSWGVSENPVGGQIPVAMLVYVNQQKRESDEDIGSLLLLRDRRFFDFRLTTNLYVSGVGSVGVIFRAQDAKTMYVLEMSRAEQLEKRLIRIVDGNAVVLSRSLDGGYAENSWYKVQIECRQSRITVGVEHGTSPMETIFDVIDGLIVSGTVGFIAQNLRSVAINDTAVDALPCHKTSKQNPPFPTYCSVYKEAYFGKFEDTWSTTSNAAPGSDSRWRYSTNIGGEAKVILQTQGAMLPSETNSPAITLLEGNRSCDSGVISFSFFPQCSNGIVGAVYDYQDSDNYFIFEMSKNFSRLRQRKSGAMTTIAKSVFTGFALSKWNNVTIRIRSGFFFVTHGTTPLISVPVLDTITTGGGVHGKVGLASYECAGVAFSKFEVHPWRVTARTGEQRKAMLPIPSSFAVNESSDVTCSYTNLYERDNYCSKQFANDNESLKECTNNFCGVCCRTTSGSVDGRCQADCEAEEEHVEQKTAMISQMSHSCHPENAPVLKSVCSVESTGNSTRLCEAKLCSYCCDTQKLERSFANSIEAHFIRRQCRNSCVV